MLHCRASWWIYSLWEKDEWVWPFSAETVIVFSLAHAWHTHAWLALRDRTCSAYVREGSVKTKQLAAKQKHVLHPLKLQGKIQGDQIRRWSILPPSIVSLSTWRCVFKSLRFVENGTKFLGQHNTIIFSSFDRFIRKRKQTILVYSDNRETHGSQTAAYPRSRRMFWCRHRH